MDRLSVLLHITSILDLCGDVPTQLVMYMLSGHDGSVDSRGSQEDTLWKIRVDQYDIIGPDEIREKARSLASCCDILFCSQVGLQTAADDLCMDQ
jgi:hypothetical protein